MLNTVKADTVRMFKMMPREGADAVRRQELIFVQHHFQNAAQTIWIDDREQASLFLARQLHAGDVARQIRTIVDKPLHALSEARQTIQHLRL